ncbi:hypothetical protein [Myroides odoratus]|uniref:hypothetical protein n=1 Tax=Myroides odoratus TaxID=256 RepID=UPI0033402BA8
MLESLEQKKRRLYGKKYLKEYIGVIKRITTLNEHEINLLSIIETDNIIEKEKTLKFQSSSKLFFNDKEELKKFIIEKLNTDSIYVCTQFSVDCGILMIDSLKVFNFQFDFDDDSSGIITLINSNLEHKVLLDFYEENGLKYIEIEYYAKV